MEDKIDLVEEQRMAASYVPETTVGENPNIEVRRAKLKRVLWLTRFDHSKI